MQKVVSKTKTPKTKTKDPPQTKTSKTKTSKMKTYSKMKTPAKTQLGDSMLRTLCSDTKINILNPNLDVKMFIKGVQTYLESIFSVPFVPNKKMLWLALKTLKV